MFDKGRTVGVRGPLGRLIEGRAVPGSPSVRAIEEFSIKDRVTVDLVLTQLRKRDFAVLTVGRRNLTRPE
jgi:hypothetical protein